MVEGTDDIDINKWNLLTVEQAKGLEFGTVFAITGRMGMNEKYISYTRALNELYVYDLELELSTPEPVTEVTKEEESNEDGSDRKKRKKRKSTEVKVESQNEPDFSVKDFFVSRGMTIIDSR